MNRRDIKSQERITTKNTKDTKMKTDRFPFLYFVLFVSFVVNLMGCTPNRPPDLAKPRVEATSRYPTSNPSWQPMSLDAAMKLIDERAQWSGEYSPIVIPRHPAEKYLKDVTIVLDPGHGMSDGNSIEKDPTYKRGPTGVREDDINLRVALLLERLLKDAGANVILTRDKDLLIGLKERAEIANKAVRPDGGVGADLFISIHHNAVNNPNANYTSVWYHGEVDDAEPALDAGRYIAHRLGAAMRTEVAKTSPLLSDQLMYPGGFGVLRACEVPGILLECSFYTHPDEEQRLRDAGYNLREAYAIYEGLCEWAYGGRPTQTIPRCTVLLSERDGKKSWLFYMETHISAGLPPWWGKDRNRILRSTIRAKLENDTRQLVAEYRDDDGWLWTSPIDLLSEPTPDREYLFTLQFTNMFKHHNHPQRYSVKFRETSPGNWVGDVTPLRVKQARAAATRPATRATTVPAR